MAVIVVRVESEPFIYLLIDGLRIFDAGFIIYEPTELTVRGGQSNMRLCVVRQLGHSFLTKLNRLGGVGFLFGLIGDFLDSACIKTGQSLIDLGIIR